MKASGAYTLADLPAEFRQYGPIGCARAEEVSADAWNRFLNWLDSGHAAEMEYMQRYPEIRRNPQLLLEGARSIITFAFPYHSAETPARDPSLPLISEYALGDDYHEIIREHLQHLITLLPEGVKTRICVDSAPILERYWGVESGLGYIGCNGALIVPGIGSRLFLAEIVTDMEIEPLQPLQMKCHDCRACTNACPTGALQDDATLDCRRCLSYLTIEHRGEWSSAEALEAVNTPAGKRTLYGCDRCIISCPLNGETANRYPLLPGLEPRTEVRNLTNEQVRNMNQEAFSRTFKRSAIKRAKLLGLKRNAR